MSTIPSMNLFSTQLVANVGMIKTQQYTSKQQYQPLFQQSQQKPTIQQPPKRKQAKKAPLSTNPVINLRSNDRIKMNIMNPSSKKPCGRCGGAK